MLRIFIVFLNLAIAAAAQIPATEQQAGQLRALAAEAPSLGLEKTEFTIEPPRPGWQLEMVSSVAADKEGNLYILQRGEKADPVVVVSPQGEVLRGWGRGLFEIPHQIRIDPEGNVWTVDSGSSRVMQFTADGRKLMDLSIGNMPEKDSAFRGATDVAFGTDGRFWVADGYGNARILEFTPEGRLVREWGRSGTAHGEFHLPHAIVRSPEGTLYIADRENGRIQWFTESGDYRGQWDHLGKTFSLFADDDYLWIGTQPRNQPNGSPGWLMKVNRKTGKVVGKVESPGHHSVHATPQGELLTGVRPGSVLWFRKGR